MINPNPDSVDVPTAAQLDALQRWLLAPEVVNRYFDMPTRIINVPMSLRWRGYHVHAERLMREGTP